MTITSTQLAKMHDGSSDLELDGVVCKQQQLWQEAVGHLTARDLWWSAAPEQKHRGRPWVTSAWLQLQYANANTTTCTFLTPGNSTKTPFKLCRQTSRICSQRIKNKSRRIYNMDNYQYECPVHHLYLKTRNALYKNEKLKQKFCWRWRPDQPSSARQRKCLFCCSEWKFKGVRLGSPLLTPAAILGFSSRSRRSISQLKAWCKTAPKVSCFKPFLIKDGKCAHVGATSSTCAIGWTITRVGEADSDEM